MHLIILLFLWLASGFLCGYIATQKNRGGIGWFFAGCVFGIFAICAVPKLEESEQAEEAELHEKREIHETLNFSTITRESLPHSRSFSLFDNTA